VIPVRRKPQFFLAESNLLTAAFTPLPYTHHTRTIHASIQACSSSSFIVHSALLTLISKVKHLESSILHMGRLFVILMCSILNMYAQIGIKHQSFWTSFRGVRWFSIKLEVETRSPHSTEVLINHVSDRPSDAVLALRAALLKYVVGVAFLNATTFWQQSFLLL